MLNFTSICSTLVWHVNTPLMYILLLMTLRHSLALVTQRDDRTHSCKSGKGRHKCDHVTSLATKLIGVMPYMVVLLNLLRWPTLLLWSLFHLIPQVNLLFLMIFLNSIKIIKTLISLFCCTYRYIFCWLHSLQFSWSLGSRLKFQKSNHW